MVDIATINQDWSLSGDDVQWILLRRTGAGDGQIREFICTSRARLARRLKARRVPDADAERVLAGLPDTVQQWRQQLPRQQRARAIAYAWAAQ